MNQNLLEKAISLAKRPYLVEINRDETTEGKPIYLARSPELEGCIAQGETVEVANENLLEARIDYIYSLLEDNLQVPEPEMLPTITTSAANVTVVIVGSTSPQKGQIKESDLIYSSPVYQFG